MNNDIYYTDNNRHIAIMIGLYGVLLSTPIVQEYHIIYSFSVSIILIIWILFKTRFRINRLELLASLLFGMSILYRIAGISTAVWGNYAKRFEILVSLYIGVFSWMKLNKKDISKINIIVGISFFANILYNIWLHATNPSVFFGIRNSTYYQSLYGHTNVATTAFQYCIILIALCILVHLRNGVHIEKEKIILYILFGFLTLYSLIYGTSSTAIISFLLAISLILTLTGNGRNISIKCFILLFAFIVFFLFSEYIMNIIVQVGYNMSGEKIGRRLEVVKGILTGSYSTDDSGYLARINYIIIDLQTWISSIANFVFGVGLNLVSVNYNGIDTNVAASLTGVGGHSGFIDMIPRYGMIGLVLELLVASNAIQFFSQTIHKNILKKGVGVVVGFVIVNNILNDLFDPGFVFVLFMIAPMFMGDFDNLFQERKDITDEI